MKCAECEAIADCKLAFGIYWREKSRQGDGCDTPFGGWPDGWRENLAAKAAPKTPADAKPDARRGRNKLVWQGEF